MSLALLPPSLLAFPSFPTPLTVHIVPHTHDDVGWLKTVDQYFSGANNTIQHAGVRNILRSVLLSLEAAPERTFTYVEQAFFQRWWAELDSATREATRRLVRQKRLEFTNGGWCMHDEAAAHYVDMVDQTTLGHRYLLEEFGEDGVPTTTWQLDPFGHSSTQAALLSAEAGMEAIFFGRIDYQDLKLRQEERRAEWIWRASPSLGPDTQVFASLTGSFTGNYGPPPGFFDWDVELNDEPVEDNPKLETYNLPRRVDDFVKAAREQASMTRGTHIMWTMGSDFQYEAAETWFINMDKIIRGVNAAGKGVKVHTFGAAQAIYSTPSRYLAAKRADASVNAWPLTAGSDLFPYADGPHMFWTGYFTSRPALKRQIRVASSFLQAVRQALVLAPRSSAHTLRPSGTLHRPQTTVRGGATPSSSRRLLYSNGDRPVAESKAFQLSSESRTVSLPLGPEERDNVKYMEHSEKEVRNTRNDDLVALEALEEALGVSQHHDAVSGTARQHVAFDYARRISSAMDIAFAAYSDALTRMGMGEGWQLCPRLNETVCPLTTEGYARMATSSGLSQSDQEGASAPGPAGVKTGTQPPEGMPSHASSSSSMFRISAWNALGQARTELLLIPIATQGATVRDATGKALEAQVHPAGETVTSYARDTNETPNILAFRAPLPPVCASLFTVELHTASPPDGDNEAAQPARVFSPAASFHTPRDALATVGAGVTEMDSAEIRLSAQMSEPVVPLNIPSARLPRVDVILENEHIRLTFSGATGRLSHFLNKASGVATNISQSFCYYTSHPGDRRASTAGDDPEERGAHQSSGAYIFRPLTAMTNDDGSADCMPVAAEDVATITAVVRGKVVQELRQSFYSKWGGSANGGASRDGHKNEAKAEVPATKVGTGRIPWLSQVVRLAAGERHASFEWTIGEIPKAELSLPPTDPRQRCVGWRAVQGCDPFAPRRPEGDLPCNAEVPDDLAGYCECGMGRRAAASGCDHSPVGTCVEACRVHTGKEIITRFTAPGIASAGRLFTDSNGRELLARDRDHRPSWHGFNQTEKVAGNFYPSTSMAAIRGNGLQLTVLLDRAQGVGSISDGEIQLMVHRRVLVDDARGVAEPLDETQHVTPYIPHSLRGGYKSGPGLVVRGTHLLSLEPVAIAAAVVRPLADRMYASPVLSFARGGRDASRCSATPSAGGRSPCTPSSVQLTSQISFEAGALAAPLPINVQLMTLSPRSDGAVLLRLSHQFSLDEAITSLSTQIVDRLEGASSFALLAKVNLSQLFRPSALSVRHATEVSLTANQDKVSILKKRREALRWPGADEEPPHGWRSLLFNFSASPIVTLGPMEIKTFLLQPM